MRTERQRQAVVSSGASYIVRSAGGFSDRQLDQILQVLHQPPDEVYSVLGGRGNVVSGKIDGVGGVVSKYYTRGGWLGKCVSHFYVRCGRIRSEIEFDLLTRVRALGVSAPEPLAYVTQGGVLYRTWLILRKIEDFQTLAELSVYDGERCEHLIPRVAEQIDRLIASGVFHVDLHPGNVLVTATDEIYLIDFDKAREYTGRANTLRDRFLCRWRRAVIKHGLPDFLSERVCADLRKDYSAIVARGA